MQQAGFLVPASQPVDRAAAALGAANAIRDVVAMMLGFQQ
jgi:hypothetical protein